MVEESKKAAEEYKQVGTVSIEQPGTEVEKKTNPRYAYGQRVRIAAIHEKFEQFFWNVVTVVGWIKTCRPGGKELMFIELNDGSHIQGLQVALFGLKSIDCGD